MDETTRQEDPERCEYLQERRLAIDAEREVSTSFDKAMLTLSAGALALSITFVHQVGPAPRLMWLLLLSWLGFSLTLLATLVSFLLSQASLRRYRAILDNRYEKKVDDERNAPAIWTKALNIASIALFTTGAALLVAFCFLNLAR
jgi:hypothetical protein